MANLIANRIRTPDGTIIQSYATHNFVEYTDKNGRYYAVDGGLEYQRVLYDTNDYENLSVYDTDPLPLKREAFHWGTRVIDGTKPVEYKALKDLDYAHIEAIIETQHHVPVHLRRLFADELNYRDWLISERMRSLCVRDANPDRKHVNWNEALKLRGTL